MGFSKYAFASLALAGVAVAQQEIDVTCPQSNLAIPNGNGDTYRCVLNIEDGTLALHYTLLEDSRLFALTSSAGGYYGIGFPENPGVMGPAEALLATDNNQAARYAIGPQRNADNVVQDDNVLQQVTDLATTNDNGLNVMFWTDNIATVTGRKGQTAQLQDDGSPILDFNWAYHTTSQALTIHTNRGSVQTNLLTGDASAQGGVQDDVQVHARLQVIAWAYIIPMAVLIKRFGPMFTEKKMDLKVIKKSYPVPFVIHAVLTTIGIILNIAMVALALERFSGAVQRGHRETGIAVLAASVFQFVMQFVKCDGNHPQRWIFRLVHMFVGLGTLVVAFITLFSGSDNYEMFYDAAQGTSFGRDIRIATIVGLGVFAIPYLLLSIVQVCWKPSAKKQQKTYHMDDVSTAPSKQNVV